MSEYESIAYHAREAELKRLKPATIREGEAASARAVAALAADKVALGDRVLLPERERKAQVRHLVNLAFGEEPVVSQIGWLEHGTHSHSLIGASVGVALVGAAPAIATPAIATIEDVCTGLHEIGHFRTLSLRYQRLAWEREAWVYAQSKALYWDAACHADMAKALGSYLEANDDKGQVLAVQAIERQISPANFERHYRPLTRTILDQFEEAAFREDHGTRRCQCMNYCLTRDAMACTVETPGFVCRSCADMIRARRQVAISKIKRESRPLTADDEAALRRFKVTRRVASAVQPREPAAKREPPPWFTAGRDCPQCFTREAFNSNDDRVDTWPPQPPGRRCWQCASRPCSVCLVDDGTTCPEYVFDAPLKGVARRMRPPYVPAPTDSNPSVGIRLCSTCAAKPLPATQHDLQRVRDAAGTRRAVHTK